MELKINLTLDRGNFNENNSSSFVLDDIRKACNQVGMIETEENEQQDSYSCVFVSEKGESLLKMASKEKLFWDLKKVIQNSNVDWIDIQKIIKDLSKQSIKSMASLE